MANGLFNLKQVMQGIQQGGWSGQKPPQVEYLVVAGGGGSAGDRSGGGGAGGLLQGLDPVPNGQTLLVTVGGGGPGGNSANSGTNGSNSVFGSIIATGGGASTYSPTPGSQPGNAGGSGGGASLRNYSLGGQGTFGQGNAGGANYVTNSTGYGGGGGGGGAGTPGYFVNDSTAGNGGSGVASVISGTVTTYAGGGGGGTATTGYLPRIAGAGGAGGGGAGSSTQNTAGTAGTANTGGGAGGSGDSGAGANGGSGIVIVSYPDVYAAAASTTGSPTVSTSGSGSISFNGSTQYVQYASNSAFNLGSSNFTIELWAYRSAGGSQVFVGQNNSSLSSRIFDIGIDSSNFFNGEVYVGATAYTISSSTTMNISTWYHVALVRNSTVMTLYVNGTSVGTVTVAGTVTSGSTPITVGRLGDSSYYTNGYLSNFRYVTGTALYTSNFTPSTSPLTAVSGTQLLLNSVSGAYLTDSSTNSFAPATTSVVGSWNQLSPFTGTGYKNRVYTWTSSGSITF